MEYFDTNIYVYAFCKNIDNLKQQEISRKLLKEKASNNSLVVSDVILYEFAFSCTKLKEEPKTIQKISNFYQDMLSRQI
ncbi:MAG: PIN domain-containing protein [Sulfurovum sp.]|nr:PIN domain-containing protein [Sulfurovaceae bacterium]